MESRHYPTHGQRRVFSASIYHNTIAKTKEKLNYSDIQQTLWRCNIVQYLSLPCLHTHQIKNSILLPKTFTVNAFEENG